MAKKYVVENAALNCQYGEESWLIVPGDRHIEISGRLMANETDYKKVCLGCGGFGACLLYTSSRIQNRTVTGRN